MRTMKFAGAAALAFVSLTLVSAEIIRTAVGQQFEPGTEVGTRLALAPSRGSAGTDERRVTALGGSPEQAAPATGAAAPVSVAGAAETVVAGPLLALVIGNGAYPDGDAPLAAPINDARAVAGELRTRGFDVELGENLSKQAMERAIQRFEEKITPGATALVYFSGHGLQVGRENYLVPVSAQIWRPEDVRRDGVGLEPLVAEMNTRGATRKLVIIDAARRNPFERRLRGFSSGLAPIAGPEGTLVLYAVAPGKIADQESDGTSVFARELIAQIRAPGLTAEEVFNRTRVTVARATGGSQVPAVFSAMTDDFSFAQASEKISEPGPTRQSAR